MEKGSPTAEITSPRIALLRSKRVDTPPVDILRDLRTVYDETELWVVILNTDLRYVYANQSYVIGMKTQWKFNVIQGEPLNKKDPLSHEKNKQLLHKALEGGRSNITTNFGLKEGMHWYNVKSFPTSHGGVGCTIEDITDVVITGQQNTSRYQYRFLRSLVHQLRSPMTGILGMIQLIKADKDNPDTPEYLDQMEKSVLFVTTLINDIVDLDEKKKLDIMPYKLSSIIDDCLYCLLALAKVRNLLFNKVLCDCTITVNDLYLKQILLTIIDNAIKFCNEGSTINIHSHFADETATIDITNEGPVISPEEESKLFEIRTPIMLDTKSKQTGFGLNRARILTERINGTITYIRNPTGSTFRITLPISHD